MRLRILGSASDTFSLGIDIDPKVFNGCLAGSGHGAPRGAGSQVFFLRWNFFFLFSSGFFPLAERFFGSGLGFFTELFETVGFWLEMFFFDFSVIFYFFIIMD